jgi:FixJ family two-component response regulator/two-component sensor histidine kinase
MPTGRTIYIVDDDAAVQRSLELSLHSAGFATESYASTKTFLAAAAKLSPGCILLNVRMPGLDGIELQARLRSSGITLPVVMMDVQADVRTVVRAIKGGAIDFIEKPIDDAALLRAIEAGLSTGADREVEEAVERIARLSRREREVLEGLIAGKPNKTIAYELGLSVRTAEVHRARMMGRLGVRKLAEAIRLAVLSNEERLASELVATRRLQELSSHLLSEDSIDILYDRILDAAKVIMRSDFASMQKYFPERGPSGELRLLGHRGFNNEAARFWEWVRPTASCTCGVALRTRERVMVPDVETCDFMAGSDNLRTYRQTGISAVQSTPLMSRRGQSLGMISTHWRQPHSPSERDLRLFDILARQAADLIERSLAEQRTKVLLREVSHRAKNILAVVQAMARQTAGEEDAKTFVQHFLARLAGLAATQELLLQSDWLGVEARELVRSQLAHVDDFVGTRVTFKGPSLRFNPAAAQTIGMALHELATNAIKYGALSNNEGVVVVNWSVTTDCLVMRWRERGGPTVVPPQRQGFGYTVLVRMVEHALDAEADLAYPSSGLDWRINAPIAVVLDGVKESNVR